MHFLTVILHHITSPHSHHSIPVSISSHPTSPLTTPPHPTGDRHDMFESVRALRHPALHNGVPAEAHGEESNPGPHTLRSGGCGCSLCCTVLYCDVMSCHVMSCHVMSCHVMSCDVMSCIVLYFVVLYCIALPCLALP